jgi:FkbH-like protein
MKKFMTEPVRLVVWDLDETFWRGTLTEGGIDYVTEYHDIVVELARRGILSSVCSKNDPATVLPLLQTKGILDYFIFPSISWAAKGGRLSQLVEATGLRPSTVLFIDDNPYNRAEAAQLIPGLQVESETFIPSMLTDSRFVGKDDRDLTRLKQYKLLERRALDQPKGALENEEFLRNSDIRVRIEYDVDAHLDRAIELVNRTNQLNYTKQRLPNDAREAREALRNQMSSFDRQVGLVQVVDKYGDYGFVGFFMLDSQRSTGAGGSANPRLIHFCFSCRTLGMLVEHWVYESLGRPELHALGEVLTDLSVPRSVNWITRFDFLEGRTHALKPISRNIVVYGGCEAQPLGVYLTPYAGKIAVYGHYAANGLFIRLNNATTALDICDRGRDNFCLEAQALGLPLEQETTDFMGEAAPETLFIFNFFSDARGRLRLSHRIQGWTLVVEPRHFPNASFLQLSEEELMAHVTEKGPIYSAEQREHVLSVGKHIRENYELLPSLSEAEKVEYVRRLLERAPLGSRVIITVNHDEFRESSLSDELTPDPAITRYLSLMRGLATEFPYVGVASVSDVIRRPSDVEAAGHYTREVYFRLAERIVEIASDLPPREDAPPPKAQLIAKSSARLASAHRKSEAYDLVRAVYHQFLGRAPDPEGERSHAERLIQGYWTSEDFLRAILSSAEFRSKWTKLERESDGDASGWEH